MGKNTKNISKRLKTSHKKGIVKRKTAYSHVDRNLADVNKFIDAGMAKPQAEHAQTPKIDLESMSFDDLKKLLTGPAVRKRPTKLSVDDANYLEQLLKRWGSNYERMSKDIKLNKMQWTAHQIEKKHESYKLLAAEIND
jgi:hypothetical protein